MNSDEVNLGDVTFDRKTRALSRRDGSAVQLRHKSKEVLGFLVENPDRTVRKSEIMDSVWADVTVSDESLVQCIADIRRTIGEDARQIVETVPREGYRLNIPAANPLRSNKVAVALVAGAATLAAVWAFWPGGSVDPSPPVQVASTEAGGAPPGTEVIDAYLEVLKGTVSASRFDSDESLAAERHFRRAIELDPAYARAYAELGTLFAVRFENDWTVLEDADKAKALFYAEKAVALDPDLWLAHYALGRLHSLHSNYDEAEAHLQKAMSLQPDNEDARAYLGIVKTIRGDSESGVAILEPVVAAHPNPPYWYYLGLGNALFNTGQYERAASVLKTCLELAKDSPYCLRFLIATYGRMGLVAEAEEATRAYASVGFDPSIGSILDLLAYLDPEDRALLETGLRSAGMPE